MDLTKQRDGVVKTAIRNVDEENLRITHTVNTKAFDRYDSVVLPKGADVKHFLNNPVVLWSHNHDEATAKIPIAKCVDLDIREDEIVVTTEFNKNDALAVKVFNAYKDGFLNTWSIGFIPKKYKKMDSENIEDINKKYNLSISKEQIEEASWGAYLVYDWELLEYSAVPVPGNPEALSADGVSGYKRELVSRGLLDADSAEDFSFKSFIERKEASEEVVEKEVSEEQSDVRSEDAPVENKEESEEVPVEEVVEQEKPVEEVAEEAVEEESEVAEVVEEEEVPAEEVSEEAETEVEPEAEVVEEVQVEESDEVINENSNDSTEDVQEESVPVAEEIEEVVEEQKNQNEKEALEKTVEELNQRNQELSERVAKMEETVKELASINSTLSEIKKSLDVDNIQKVRESVLQKKKGTNPESFFSNLFRE